MKNYDEAKFLSHNKKSSLKRERERQNKDMGRGWRRNYQINNSGIHPKPERLELLS